MNDSPGREPMTARSTTLPTTPASATAPGVARAAILAWAATWAAGCQLSLEGAPCPCGPGWTCLEEPGKEGVCARPYCVFWTYQQRADGVDVELPADVVVVTSYVSAVPPGSDLLVTGSGTLSIESGDHRVFVEPYGVVLSLGDGNEVYLREHALYLDARGAGNTVFHEPGAVPANVGPGTLLREQPAIDFVGLVEAPFATAFREIMRREVDVVQGGLHDYVVRSSGVLYFPRARAGNIFVEPGGLVSSIDYSGVAFLQSGAVFDASEKRHVIHYVDGAIVTNDENISAIEHASIELDLCTM
jgi:hypothetical protein